MAHLFRASLALAVLLPGPLRVAQEAEEPLPSDAVEVLLVVARTDERTARIETWLRERGFDVATTTYVDVTAEACEARDVVVADSDYFGRHGSAIADVRRFTRTETPIVAVGFLGTELVESQGVAMASGYI